MSGQYSLEVDEWLGYCDTHGMVRVTMPKLASGLPRASCGCGAFGLRKNFRTFKEIKLWLRTIRHADYQKKYCLKLFGGRLFLQFGYWGYQGGMK